MAADASPAPTSLVAGMVGVRAGVFSILTQHAQTHMTSLVHVCSNLALIGSVLFCLARAARHLQGEQRASMSFGVKRGSYRKFLRKFLKRSD